MKKLLLAVALVLSGATVFAQDAAALIEQAQTALVGKNYTESAKLYDQAFANAGEMDLSAHYYNAALAADQSENYESAIKYYDKAIAAGINADKSLAGKCDALISLGKYDEAIAADADNAGQWNYKIGVTTYKAGDFETAATYFGNAVTADYKGDVSALYQYRALAKLGKDDEAMAVLTAAAEKYPDSKVTKTLSSLLLKQGNGLYKEGAGILSDANAKVNAGSFTTEDPQYATAIANSNAKFKEALSVLEQAKTYDATNANAQKLIDACNSAIQ